VHIEPYTPQHREAVVSLSLRAWAPVFDSLQKTFSAELYQAFYPDDWRVSQQKAVEDVCAAEDAHVWVAREADATMGFVAVKLHAADKMGEIYMVAVDPEFQGRGIGGALVEFAVAWMKEAGMTIAMIETGADPGHAPARRAYEKAGFELFSVARYFKTL